MKRFLINISIFFFLVLMIMALLIFGAYSITSQASFALPEDVNIIIAGDSLIARAIDDKIFSHSVNTAQPGTGYLYSYIKLKRFLDENKHIDKVLLSFHGYTMKKSRDEWITGRSYILSYLPDYFFMFSGEEIKLFLTKSDSMSGLFSAITRIPVKSMYNIQKMASRKRITYKELNIGGYTELDGEFLSLDLETREVEETESYSQYQHDYLLKIVELCREKNIELLLFITPSYNSAQYGGKSALMDYYNTYLSELKCLDFSDFDVPEYGYYDIFHLNTEGSEIFSRYLEDNYEMIFERSFK